MRQLVQLRDAHDRIESLGAIVIAVFREESEGVEGLEKTRKKTNVDFPLLLDLNTKTTGRYSPDGFDTYIIDPEGVIRAILTGTKAKRPTGSEIVDQLEQLADKQPEN